jgi:hypothetical protein
MRFVPERILSRRLVRTERLDYMVAGQCPRRTMQVTCSGSAAVFALAQIVRAVRDAIVCYDQQIETLAREHPDFAITDSLPGAGPALAPRLIAVLGTQRDRFHSAGELQILQRNCTGASD